MKHGVPLIGPLLFLLYMNDLPVIINNKSIPILFATDTRIVFTHSDFIDYENNISTVFETSNKWFNLLKPNGHVMHQQFNIQQLYAVPTLYLCVLYLSENK